MKNGLESNLELYKFSDGLRKKAMAGLTEEALLHRTSPLSNPLIWMFGHIAVMRFRIGNGLGAEEKVPMEEFFGFRSKPEHTGLYPSLAEVDKFHKKATRRLYARIEAATGKLLNQTSPRSKKTIRELVNLLAHHEAMHLGQILFLRKHLGLDSKDPLMD